MGIYRNTKTGALIEVSSKISGNDWEEVLPMKKAPDAPVRKKKGKKK